MPKSQDDLYTSIGALAFIESRAAAARSLAKSLGAHDLVIFVRDMQLEVFLPAPGFLQTLPNGIRWSRFVTTCMEQGQSRLELPYPDRDTRMQAHGVAVSRDIVLVFLGGAVRLDALEHIKPLLPLVVAAVQGERLRESLTAEVAVAHRIAVESRSLAEQLDGARAAVQQALAEAQESNRQMRRQATELSSIIEALPDAAFVCNPQGFVVRANRHSYGLISNATHDPSFVWESVHLREIFVRPFGQRGQLDVEHMLMVALRGEAQTSVGFTIQPTRDGSVAQFLVNAAPVRDEAGDIIEVVFVATDVTELHRLSRQKDDFLSIASHELRTPLTTTKAMFQFLMRKLRQPGTMEHILLDRIMKSIERMERLIADLIDGARIESGNLSLVLQPVDLVKLCHELVETQASTLERVVTASIPENAPTVMADSDRIAQVIANLIINAAKYSDQDQPVELTLSYDEQYARVAVIDHGVGIPANELAHVFERFYRAPGVEVQSGSGVGLGLGLYIACNIVERHHGRMSAQSTPGNGSTFWFELPLGPAPALE